MGGGIALIVYVANGSASDKVDLVDSERELIEAGTQYTCTLTSFLENMQCRDTEVCSDWTSTNFKTTCASTVPMQQCYCQAYVSLVGTETTIPAYFSVYDTEGQPEDWCNEVLNSGSWPNFMTHSSDESLHAYCNFRAYGWDIDIEGTNSGLVGETATTCAVDAALDPDYQCVGGIAKEGFTCVQISDGRIFVGSKDDLITQREECSTMAAAYRTAFLVLGIIAIVLSVAWIVTWGYWAFKSYASKE